MAANLDLNGGYVDTAVLTDRKFSSILSTRIVPQMRYNEVYCGPGGLRVETEALADSGTAFTSQAGKIVFPIKSKAIVDFRHASIEMNVSATVTGGTAGTYYLTRGIWNLFQKVTVKTNGSNEIVSQFNKNVVRSLQYAFVKAPSVEASIGDACWGTGSTATRVSRVASFNYMIPLDIAFLANEEIPFMNVENFLIEMELAPDSQVICYGTQVGGTPAYTISNPRIRYFETTYQSDLMAAYAALKVIYHPHTTYSAFQTNVPAGSNNIQFNVPLKAQGIKRFVSFMKPVASAGNPTVADYFTEGFNYNNAESYQLKIDQTYYPPQAYKAGGTVGPQEAYLAALRGMDRYELFGDTMFEKRNNGASSMLLIDNWAITLPQFTSNRFLMVNDIKTFVAHDENILTKMDLTNGSSNVILYVNLGSGQPAVNTTLFTIAYRSALILQFPNGTFNLIE